MAESPPKRMLVTVGTERTQIAVLEERTLVEHYVTQASEASYVGNIYKGRVQNVLPGMEAAFVDIGKGRNGVLYAGEVNYDEADRDGGLPRIEQALKPGQTVLVQVTKDPMGTKGARLTQHLSLAGRYCVLAPGRRHARHQPQAARRPARPPAQGPQGSEARGLRPDRAHRRGDRHGRAAAGRRRAADRALGEGRGEGGGGKAAGVHLRRAPAGPAGHPRRLRPRAHPADHRRRRARRAGPRLPPRGQPRARRQGRHLRG